VGLGQWLCSGRLSRHFDIFRLTTRELERGRRLGSLPSATLTPFLGQLERIGAHPALLATLVPTQAGHLTYIDGHMIAYWSRVAIHKGKITLRGRLMAGSQAVIAHTEASHAVLVEYHLAASWDHGAPQATGLTFAGLPVRMDESYNVLKLRYQIERTPGMPSPFPGMDPYLEGYLWPDVHHALASEIRRQLAPQVRPRYAVRIEVATCHDDNPESEIGIMYPDVEIWRRRSAPQALAAMPIRLPKACHRMSGTSFRPTSSAAS
jgi:hypothetical protein